MAPMSVYPDADLDPAGPGQAISEVSPFLVDLPVGEGNAVVRLSQIAHATESHPTAASLVDARTIVTLSGFAPPTLHAMGIRVATSFSARLFNLLITNVPGAQNQMYVAGTKLLETYAVPPLLNNQVLAIGVTSYNGMLYFGINADRDAMSDVDVSSLRCCGNRSTNCWKPRSNRVSVPVFVIWIDCVTPVDIGWSHHDNQPSRRI